MTVLSAGEELGQHWDGFRVFVSIFLSAAAAFAGVVILDHSRWRDDSMACTSLLTYHSQTTATVALALGAIWSMHFTGMSALTLDGVQVSFHWPLTLLSAAAPLLCLRAGFHVAGKDIFAGADRLDRLRGLLVRRSAVKLHQKKQQMYTIYLYAFLGELQHLVAAAVLTAVGVCVMHFVGMTAMRGPFEIHWNPWLVMLACVIAVVVSTAGFWILFRLLVFKASLEWLRPACAVVISIAVNAMHYTGMLAAHYTYNPDGRTTKFKITESFQMALALVVMTGLSVVQWSIAVDQRGAYQNLKDANLNGLAGLDSTQNSRTCGKEKDSHRSGRSVRVATSTANDGQRAGPPPARRLSLFTKALSMADGPDPVEAQKPVQRLATIKIVPGNAPDFGSALPLTELPQHEPAPRFQSPKIQPCAEPLAPCDGPTEPDLVVPYHLPSPVDPAVKSHTTGERGSQLRPGACNLRHSPVEAERLLPYHERYTGDDDEMPRPRAKTDMGPGKSDLRTLFPERHSVDGLAKLAARSGHPAESAADKAMRDLAAAWLAEGPIGNDPQVVTAR